MTYSTTMELKWRTGSVLSVLIVVAIVVMAWAEMVWEGMGGWVSCPAAGYGRGYVRKGGRGRRRETIGMGWQGVEEYVLRSYGRLCWQQGILLLLGGWSAEPGWRMIAIGLPLMRWLVEVSRVAWPRWGSSWWCWLTREGLYRWHQGAVLIALCGLGGEGMSRGETGWWCEGPGLLAMSTFTVGDEIFEGRVLTDGTYEVYFGEYVIRHQPVDEFDRRMFLLSLRCIYRREGSYRRPMLRQEWLAGWFNTHQELISRWQSYRRGGDWRRLMSRRHGPLLSMEEQQAIVNLWASHIWWSMEQVQRALADRGMKISLDSLRQVGRESGLHQVRRTLRQRFHLEEGRFELKEGWLIQNLYEALDQAIASQEQPTQELIDLKELKAWQKVLAMEAEESKPLPWAYRLQQVLFGQWEDISDGSVRCCHCGTVHVRRKSGQPRMKKYYDAQMEVHEVAVYRYYCKNPDCAYKTFTDLPAGLLPYSRWPLSMRLLAVQTYQLGRAAYRTTATALGVSTATAYRWVSALGGQLLPVAALFGVVRCSGVVGIDEKWVKVPINDKPWGKHRHWMYVYVAVDVHTYDLLHIALYPTSGKDETRLFLLALKAKGYHPRVDRLRSLSFLWRADRSGFSPGCSPSVRLSLPAGYPPGPAPDLWKHLFTRSS